MDRAHSEEDDQQFQKASFEMESTVKKEELTAEEYLTLGFRCWHGRQWALLRTN